MTPQEHYSVAEQLLAKGRAVVDAIGVIADTRSQFNPDDKGGRIDYRSATEEMDELGKKAMGLWAQAQVHATLATIPFRQIEVMYAGEVGG